jgi:hypothetical protein
LIAASRFARASIDRATERAVDARARDASLGFRSSVSFFSFSAPRVDSREREG